MRKLFVKLLVVAIATLAFWTWPSAIAFSSGELSPDELSFDLQINLMNAMATALAFVICYPIMQWKASQRFRNGYFLQPVIVSLFVYVLIVFCRIVFIPIVTPVSYYLGEKFPMGHFGYSALFAMSFVTVFFAMPLVRIVDALIPRGNHELM